MVPRPYREFSSPNKKVLHVRKSKKNKSTAIEAPTATTKEMCFLGGLKPQLDNNDGGSKITVYPGDVITWEATTMV